MVERRRGPTGAASFAQLGIGRQEVSGLGRREVALQIDRPAGWAIKGDPRLDLVVDTSAGLDEKKSSIQVQLAGVDLGSRRVQPGGGPHTYGFDIPAGLIDRGLDGRAVRSLDLTVAPVLSVPHTRCEPVNVESAHATILPTSAFRLPHDSFDGRELGRFPHPLAPGPPSPSCCPIARPRHPGRRHPVLRRHRPVGASGTPPPS